MKKTAILLVLLAQMSPALTEEYHLTYFRIKDQAQLVGLKYFTTAQDPTGIERQVAPLLKDFQSAENSFVFTTALEQGKSPAMSISFSDRTVKFSFDAKFLDSGLCNVTRSEIFVDKHDGNKVRGGVQKYDDLYGFDDKPLFIYLRAESDDGKGLVDLEGIALSKLPLITQKGK